VAHGGDHRRQGAAADFGPARVARPIHCFLACAGLSGRYGSGATVDDERRAAGAAQ
jgi:hypothetical protein